MPRAETSRIRVTPCVCALFIAAVALSGCYSGGYVVVEGEEGRVILERPGVGYPAPAPGIPPPPSQQQSKNYRYEANVPQIPPGHLPPPGMCRIWYPGRPPGQQPPPRPCHELVGRVPPGAWLIRGDARR